MSYQALARKWRPKCFADLVGQQHVVQALHNAIERDILHHAYLFTGTRGVGKTTVARILTKCLNCERGHNTDKSKPTATPCGVCSTCREIDEGRFMDLLEIDAASRTGVDNTRELMNNVPYAPTKGRYKVYLIDEVHMFSDSSFNALLKTLEEPPQHVKFILATTDPQKIPLTVLSRCLQFHLKRLLPEEISKQLATILTAEGVTYEPTALHHLAQAADGSMRDGLSILDQALAFGNGMIREADVCTMLGTSTKELVVDLVESLASGSAAKVLAVVPIIMERTSDLSKILPQLTSILHQIAVGQVVPATLGFADTNPRFGNLAQAISPADIQLFYQIALLGQRDLEWSADNPRAALEMVLLRMLAFRPAGYSITRQIPVQTNQLSNPSCSQAVNPPPSVTKSYPQKATTTHPTVVTATSAGSLSNAPPIIANTAVSSTAMPRLANNEDWRTLIRQLGLTAMANQLANNCELVSWDGHTVRLNLDATVAKMRGTTQEGRLLAALQQRLGPHIKLDLRVNLASTETAARLEAKERNEHQQEQRANFAKHPLVEKLQDTFKAQILPDSIRRLDDGYNSEPM